MAHELMRAFPMQQTYVDSVQAARVVADELLEARVERDRLAMQLEAAQAALRDAIASSTANGEERDALASVVTRQRSGIDTLRAELEAALAKRSYKKREGKPRGPMPDWWKAKISAARKGHTTSADTRRKISEGLKNSPVAMEKLKILHAFQKKGGKAE